MIRLDHIAKQFVAKVLFQDLSWMIRPGARLGLVGPNGAGKTTILRILSGRERPDSGEVHKPPSLQIGYLPQEVETVEGGTVLPVVLAGFGEVAALERDLQQIAERLGRLPADDPESPRLTERYGRMRARFEQLDGDRLEARAKSILSGLGIAASSFGASLETLSGGWRMRVVLARLLLGAPDLLLLDEPTNHLDLQAIDWLEEFLASFEGAFVVVSHDRYFLNRMVRGVVELERGRLTTYEGNYDGYLADRAARETARIKAAKQQQREIAKTERFIERFRYKNTKARQVQSRVKSLEKLERVRVESSIKRVRFGFPPAPRSGDIVVRAEGVTKRFGERTVYAGMDLLLRRGDRVALVGPNGAGKSTLLKLLAGRLRVDAGRLELGHKVAQQYYAQHQLDDLDARRTVLEEMEGVAPDDQRRRLRGLLGCFLFSGDDVAKRVGVLSGGEKARLALAKLLLRPVNLLLLDEPTNHLDLQSREVLEDALNEYEGTLVVISHDRYFINRVATSIAEIGDGRAVLHDGDYDEYLAWQRRRRAERPAVRDEGERTPGEADLRDDRREVKRREAEERNRRYREQKTLEDALRPIEAEIEPLERRLGELEAMQADASVYSDPERAREVAREKAEAEKRLRRLYEAWGTAADGDTLL